MKGIKYRKPEELRDSGVEWIKAVPYGWKIKKIKYLCDGDPNSFVDGDWIESPHISDRGVRLIQTGNIGIGEYIDKGFRYISEKDFRLLNCTEIFEGDILICRLASPVGRACLAPKMDIKMITSVDICRLKPNAGYLNRFLLFSLSQRNYINHCELIARGGTRQRISRTQLGNIAMIIPGYYEQQKIANFLDIKTAQFNSAIAKREQLIQKLEEAKKSLISEVVTGKVKIVDGEMVPRKPEKMKDSGVEWLGMIPKDWAITKLKYLMIINPVKSELRKNRQLCSFVPMNKLHNGTIETDGEKAVNEVYDGYTYFRTGDIIMAKVTPCFENGNIAIASNLTNNIGFGSSELNVFRVNKFNDKKYIYFFLQENHFMRYGSSHMTGVVGLKRVPTDYIANHNIAIPDLSEQQKIANFLQTKINQFDSIIAKNKFQIQKLKQAKQSLISEAVTGKIDLRDWEIIEEAEAK